MEEGGRSNNINYDSWWCSKTNWTIADGSLVNSITFESSLLSPIINGDHSNSNPLILHPPSPDPSPCEITISFAKKHELRQLYVRSTARVYEIYYASDLVSSNEYLCTVHCGVATREEEVLCTPRFEEAVVHLTGAIKESDEKKSKSDRSLNTNEDDWVEVKALDSPQFGNGNNPLSSNFNAKQGESLQDLYEATVEINDAEPCMSITLRMLSLQNRGRVFVDEIYVFGDPVEPSDSDNRLGQVENQAGCSLMAMFMPTLLQLPRTRSEGQMKVDHTIDTKEKQKSQVIGSNATDSINIAKKIQQGGDSGSADKREEKLHETFKATAVPSHTEMPAQVSYTVCKADSSSIHIENVLDQLVSKVSRLEDLFLRFEERMLKPVNSIDARLQRVEQQLEELNMKTQNSGLQCTRISAPEFSWHESDDNFFDDSESNVVESEVKDYIVSNPADDVIDSSNDSHSHSSHLGTGPVSSNAYDEEENNALEAATVSANYKPKHAMTVDDALASALGGFLSSVSAESHKYTQALVIKAPDFSVEEDNTSDKKASPEVESKKATDSPICFNALDVNECTIGSLSTSSNNHCLDGEVEAAKSVDDHHSEKVGQRVDDLCPNNEEGKDDSLDRGIHSMVPTYRPSVATGDIKYIEVGDRLINTSVDERGTENQFIENQSDDGSGSTQEGAILNSDNSISEGQMRVDLTVDTKEKQKSQVIGSSATDSSNVANKIQQGGDSGSADEQEEKLQQTFKATALPSHMEMPAQFSYTECKADSSSSHIENILDQLVSKVSRLEDFFLRFEERMLKPVNSIDARLQRLELNMKPQNSGLRCTRISAPEFSWLESDDNFFDDSESNVVVSDVKDYIVSNPADGVVDSSNVSHSHSSLLGTGSVSSNACDEEENNALEAATVSADYKPKHAMTVDDALASALGGFLSSVSAESLKHTQSLAIKLAIKAPDFSVEDDNTSGQKASPEVEGKKATDPPICFNATDVSECTIGSLSTSSNNPCLEGEVAAAKSVDDHHSEKVGEGVDDLCQNNEEGKGDSLDRGIHSMVAPYRPSVETEGIKYIEVGDRLNNTSVDELETGNQFLENQFDDGSGSTQEGAVLNAEYSISEEVIKERSDKDVRQDLKISLVASVDDFEISLLDEKFISLENSNNKSPFEAHLEDILKTNVEASLKPF